MQFRTAVRPITLAAFHDQATVRQRFTAGALHRVLRQGAYIIQKSGGDKLRSLNCPIGGACRLL